VQLLHEGRPVVVAFTIKYINSLVFFSETVTRIANSRDLTVLASILKIAFC
jgi:hypothetical protein